MNPLPCTKCAGRLFMALAAITSILFIAGCGSSNFVQPNQQGFSDSSFSGTYVISISGTDVNTTTDEVVPFAIAGTITPNGSGGFNTGGTLDINDPGNLGVSIGTALETSSSYNVTSDGRATGTLVTSVASFNIDFVLSSPNGGLISRFDDNGNTIGTGSGTIDLQTATGQASLGSFAFALSGADSSANPLATVGAFTLNTTTGAITSGTQDINDDNSSSPSNGTAGVQITGGSVVLNSAGTLATAQITNASDANNLTSFGFDAWVIDSTHLKFIETDTTLNVLSGDAFTQQTAFPTGQVVFTFAGQTLGGSSAPFVAGGYATAAASGALSNGVEDYNNGVTANTVPTFTAAGSNVGGRYQLTTESFTNGTSSNLAFAAYPSSGGVLMLEDDDAGLALGAALVQSATALNSTGGYALNLTGLNNLNPNSADFLEVDNIGQFDPGTPGTAGSTTPNMTGALDESALDVPATTSSLNDGVYIPDSPADGRGSIDIPNLNTLLGFLTLQYYVVDSSTVLFIDVDSESVTQTSFAQVAAGTFVAQNSSASSEMAAAAHKASFMFRPFIRPHATLKKSK